MDPDDFNPFTDLLPGFAPADQRTLNPTNAINMVKTMFAPVKTIADQVRPTPEQLRAQPGDLALLAASNAVINIEMSIAILLDPAEYAETFPDWEDRLMRSWVLARWTTSDGQDTDVGWFERARLIPLDQAQYDELLALLPQLDTEEDTDALIPDWVKVKYRGLMEAMHASDPDKVATPVICGKCGGREVELHGTRYSRFRVEVGIQKLDDGDKYVNLDSIEMDESNQFHLHCGDCGAYKEVERDEVRIHHI